MRTRYLCFAFAVGAPLAAIAGCGSQARNAFDGAVAEDSGTGTGTEVGPSLVGETGPPRTAHMTGTVYAPNGQLPVSGALVYLTSDPPEAIPQQAYCDKCVTLPEGTFGYSGPDGKFDFTTEISNQKFLVVQKGQFRRVRDIAPVDGTNAVAKDDTTFPSKTDVAAGDDTPRIVVLQSPEGPYDHVEDALTKLGVTDYVLLPRTTTPTGFFSDPAELAKYHIIFIPCRARNEAPVSDETAKANLRDYVTSGGKIYVTDYAYEYVRQPFPPFITWQNQTATIGSAAGTKYDAPATVDDPGLQAWLAAQGHTTFDLKDNWTRIESVAPQPGNDENGDPVTITPKVWVEATVGGKTFPASVTFQQACGRVLYSTYHTEPNTAGGFLPQEKALFHVVLEVGVCLGELPGGGPH